MKQLLEYYRECFEMVNTFHFNSDNTRKVYEQNLGKINGKVVSITHYGIKDNRKQKSFSEKGLIVGFIGNEAPYKGLHILKSAAQGLDIQIIVWGGTIKEEGNIHFKGKFDNSMLRDVYNEMDVLVVPSIWLETFSLVTLEALSYGTPVIVSDNVGAKDIVKEYMPEMVYSTEEELKSILAKCVLDKSKLKEYNENICKLAWEHDSLSHARKIIDEIYK